MNKTERQRAFKLGCHMARGNCKKAEVRLQEVAPFLMGTINTSVMASDDRIRNNTDVPGSYFDWFYRTVSSPFVSEFPLYNTFVNLVFDESMSVDFRKGTESELDRNQELYFIHPKPYKKYWVMNPNEDELDWIVQRRHLNAKKRDHPVLITGQSNPYDQIKTLMRSFRDHYKKKRLKPTNYQDIIDPVRLPDVVKPSTETVSNHNEEFVEMNTTQFDPGVIETFNGEEGGSDEGYAITCSVRNPESDQSVSYSTLLETAEIITQKMVPTENSLEKAFPFCVIKNLTEKAKQDSIHLNDGEWNGVSARTGLGKSVLNSLLSIILANRGEHITLLEPSTMSVMKTAGQINRWLNHLPESFEAIPIFSRKNGNFPKYMKAPVSLTFDRYKREAQNSIDTPSPSPDERNRNEWFETILDHTDHECSLLQDYYNDSETKKEAIKDHLGSERCMDLRFHHEPFEKNDSDDEQNVQIDPMVCPQLNECSRPELFEKMMNQPIVVTSHGYFRSGKIEHFVEYDSGDAPDSPTFDWIEKRPPAENIIMKKSSIVMVDEVDQFQASLFSSMSTSVNLFIGARESIGQGNHISCLKRTRNMIDDLSYESKSDSARVSFLKLLNNLIDSARILDEFLRSHDPKNRTIPLSGYQNSLNAIEKLDQELIDALFDNPDEYRDDFKNILDHPAEILDYKKSNSYLSLLHDNGVRNDENKKILEKLALFYKNDWGHRRQELRELNQLVEKLLGPLSKDDETHDRMVFRLIVRRIKQNHRYLYSSFNKLEPELYPMLNTSKQKNLLMKFSQVLSNQSVNPVSDAGLILNRQLQVKIQDKDTNRINGKETSAGDHNNALELSLFSGDPYEYMKRFPNQYSRAISGGDCIAIGSTATTLKGSSKHWVNQNPTITVPDQSYLKGEGSNIQIKTLPFEDVFDQSGKKIRKQNCVSGVPKNVEKRESRYERLIRLVQAIHKDELFRDHLTTLRENSRFGDDLLVTTLSYDSTYNAGHKLIQMIPESIGIKVLVQSDFSPEKQNISSEHLLNRDQVRTFGQKDERILVAPMMAVNRGINILDENDNSAIGEIMMVERPIPPPGTPARIQALLAYQLHERLSMNDQTDHRKLYRTVSSRYKSITYNETQPVGKRDGFYRNELYASILVEMIQLIGRGRRGVLNPTSVRFILADPAFIGFQSQIHDVISFLESENPFNVNQRFEEPIRAFRSFQQGE